MRIKLFVALLIVLASSVSIQAQIQVSKNGRFLMTRDGEPFFWLGDTDWELFHRLTREETEIFLETRKQQGFNVIQAVALAEFNGIHGPNRYGDLPLINDDPSRLAVTEGADPLKADEYDYWDHVDFVIQQAAEKGLYVGLLPTWGDKVAHHGGDGPLIFNTKNAAQYATTLAKRYAKQWNIIWILGGDRAAVYTENQNGAEIKYDDRPIWRAMANAIEAQLGKKAFITYHTWGGNKSTSEYLHNESWLDMNSFQSGHGSREVEPWKWVTGDLRLRPQKPTLDMEPCYEDHPVNPWDGKWTRQRGYFRAYDVRARTYRGVFAGACGVTYGHHQVWQFLNKELNPPINIGDTIIGWQAASHAEAASQMEHLKNLMLSRPYFSRIEDPSLVRDGGTTFTDQLIATRDVNGAFAMIYLPLCGKTSVDVGKVSGKTKNVWWFDPKTGLAFKEKSVIGSGVRDFTPPQSTGDIVLVIDDASRNFPAPGTVKK